MAPGKRLSRGDWIAAGLRALLRDGPQGVGIEPVAASLGATKGSGYWHFAGRQDLLTEVLVAWRQARTDDLVAGIEAAGGTPRERMSRLLDVVTAAVEHSPAEVLLMGSPDPVVQAAVAGAVAARVGYLERLLRDSGLPRPEARTNAVVAYSAFLGQAMLGSSAPGVLPTSAAGRRRIRAAMVEAAFTPSSP